MTPEGDSSPTPEESAAPEESATPEDGPAPEEKEVRRPPRHVISASHLWARLREQLELGRGGSPVRVTGLLLLAVLAVELAMIGSYVGALHEPQPHDVPVSIAGPPTLTLAAAQALRAKAGEEFTVRIVTDTASAREAIDERDAYAALIVGPRGDRLLVASAASALIAEELPAAVRAAEPPGRQLRVTDVKPLPADDARGISPFYLVVGWVVGGYLGATILGLARGGAARSRSLAAIRLGALALYAIASGVLGVLIVQAAVGVLEGGTLALIGAGALIVFATGAATAALQALLGVAGTALAIVVFVAIGNPASGGVFATELLPHPWRDVGALLPPGAGTTLVRNLSYFGGNAIGGALAVLGAYSVLGAAITLAVGGRRRPGAVAEAEAAAAPGIAA